jgi:hypothetical protein
LKYVEKKKERKQHSSKKKNSIEVLVGNEEKVYPVSDPNKTMINITIDSSDAHKTNPSKRKSWR